MKIQLRQILFTCAVLTMFSPATARACSCAEKPAVQDAYEAASIVFVGRVSSIRTSPLKEGMLEVKLLMMRALKKPEETNPKFVIVYTPANEGLCGFPFSPEQDYLVYADGNPARYRVDLCGRTAILEAAQKDLTALSK